MKILRREQILVDEKRQRSSVPPRHIAELRESIHTVGLLHPPVVVQLAPDSYRLIAGFCRLTAIDLISSEDNTFFYCNKQTVLPGEVPVLELNDALSPSEIQEAELQENIIREDLPWPDRIAALAAIHNLRVETNPAHTPQDTGRELATKGGIDHVGAGGVSGAGVSRRITDAPWIARKVQEALLISKHLDDPAIAKARNSTEAFHLVMAREEKAFAAELIKRTAGIAPENGEARVVHGNLLEHLPRLEPGLVDLILADPPYGIGADAGGFRARTVHHHNYADDVDSTKTILQCILTEGFRVTRSRANMFLFCDIDLFCWLKETAARAGWKPFRTPLTWVKSDSEGLAPWGRGGFRRTTEWLFFATKGEKGLYHAPVDVLRVNRVARHEREYGPQKPTDLLRQLIECSTLPGDLVLDPCCGSGSTLVAARQSKRRSLGIELDESGFNLALVNSQRDLSVSLPDEELVEATTVESL